MRQGAWRSIVAVVAAGWFLVAAFNLGSYADPVALALIDVGRIVLVGLAVLSLALVDVDWASEQARRFARAAAQPTT
jgi:hypothetical protein